MGYVDGKPACSYFYIIQEDGSSFTNMICVYKQFRGFGYPIEFVRYGLQKIAEDPNVKNKDVTFGEVRLEMIPFWVKKLGDDFATFGEKYMGENGIE